jgi:ketosteroid isomerase-like protein
MRKVLALLGAAALLASCSNEPANVASSDKTATEAVAPRDYEIGDEKFVDVAKKGYAFLQSGDIDQWIAGFADNAVYRWNNGDSLAGKAAILGYWKKRRGEVIETLQFSNEVWMPVKLNKPQVPNQKTGDYVLSWHDVYAKYKGGKDMTQRMHTVFHFNEDGKIDRVSQYLDRALINAALPK